MDLLDEPLPEGSLKPDVEPQVFFDRCEAFSISEGWRIDRRREYAGTGYDQLNLHLHYDDELPLLRMVSTPTDKGRIRLDVVAQWSEFPIPCSEYRSTFLGYYQRLQDIYKGRFGHRLRIRLPKCRPHFDRSTTDRQRLIYIRQKFREAVRSMALGGGDIRERLLDAYQIIHVVRPKELPNPLQVHFELIIHELTKHSARYRRDSNVEATLRMMRRKTGEKIATRIHEILDALNELGRGFRD